MEIQYLDPHDWGPTIGQRASVIACPNIPEFSFSPKKGRRIARRWMGELPEPINPHQGPMPPPMVTNPRRLHSKRFLGPIEQNWYDGIPFFKKTAVDGELLHPIGTMDTLEGLQHLFGRISREAEIQLIANTQQDGVELATIRDRLATNGIQVLSSSFDDDDGDEWDRLGARHLPDPRVEYRSQTEYSTLERNIEWEKYFLACDLPIKSAVAHDGQNWIGVAPEDRRKFTEQLLLDQAARLKASGWRQDRTIDEVEHDRHIARWRKTIGSGDAYDPTPPPDPGLPKEWTGEDYEEEEAKNVGEVELSYHGEGEPHLRPFGSPYLEAVQNPFEPREEDLWPYSQVELLHILHCGLQLTDEEQRWADSRGLRLPAPSRQRLNMTLTLTQNERGEGKHVEEAEVLSA